MAYHLDFRPSPTRTYVVPIFGLDREISFKKFVVPTELPNTALAATNYFGRVIDLFNKFGFAYAFEDHMKIEDAKPLCFADSDTLVKEK
jgi:hypothetical protein